MADRIKQSDVSEKDVYGLVTESAKKFDVQVTKTNTKLAKQADLFNKMSGTTLPQNQKQIQALMVANNGLVKIAEKKNEVDKLAIKTDKTLQKARLEELRIQKQREVAMDRFEKKRQKEIKTAQKARKETIDSANAYKRLTKQVDQAQARFKRLAAQYGVTDSRAIKARKTFEKLDDSLRKVNNAARDGKRDVGRYGLAMDNAKGQAKRMIGQFLGVMAVFRIFKAGINIIKDFQQSQANLASVLGVNVDEMAALTEQAKELGATTRFTASQVAELQLELAKLGFTQQQIQEMTESTLLLAAAAGTDLATAATVAGSTLRGFGLDAADTQRVVDVMAKSFSSSSLDMSKFSAAMSSVAPVAKTFGFSIESATALLGTLTDSGIDASTAGTGLKNMMLDANKAGLTLEEALEKINSSTDKAGTSFDLFGKRGAVLGVVLAENTEATGALEEKLLNAGGAAEEMADKQLDTLQGSLDLLKSAWEGLILSMDEAGGVGEKLRNGIKFLAENLGTILTVLRRVVLAFVAFKVAMKAMELAKAASEFKAAGGSIKNMGKGMTEATTGAKAFGKALKGIGLAAAITILIEVALALHDVASGAAAARRETELYDQAVKNANSTLEKFRDNLAKQRQQEINNIKELLSLGRITEEEAARRTKALLEGQKSSIRGTIQEIKLEKARLFIIKQQKDAALELARTNLANTSASNIIAFTAARLAFDDAQESALLATAAFDEQQAVLAGLAEDYGNLGQEVFDTGLEINGYTESLERSTVAAREAQAAVKDLTAELKKAADAEKELANIKEDFAIEDIQARLETELEFTARTGVVRKEMIDFLISEEERLRRAQIERRFLDALDEATTAAEVELAYERRTQALIRLDDEFASKKKETLEEANQLQEDFAANEVQTNEDKVEAIKEQEQGLADFLKDLGARTLEEAIKNSKEKQDLIGDEVKASEALARRLLELADDGSITAEQSLKEQDRVTAERLKAKEEEARKERLLEEIQMVYQAINNFMEQGDQLPEATLKATTGVFGVRELLNVVGFYKGTKGKLKDEDNPLRAGKDGHLIWADGEEMIINPEYTNELEGAGINTTDHLVKSAILGQHMMGGGMAVASYAKTTGADQELLLEIRTLTQAVKDKPELNIEAGKISQMAMAIRETRTKGKRKTNNIFIVK